MTRGSILEYKEAVRWRYLKAGKKEKGRILGEFIQVTRYHRKAAIRLLRRYGPQRQRSRRGRRRRYGDEVLDALREVWEASDRLCSKRLKPFLGELVRVMRQLSCRLNNGKKKSDAQGIDNSELHILANCLNGW